jgi:hypothetical protein
VVEYEAVINFCVKPCRESQKFNTAEKGITWLNKKLEQKDRSPFEPRLYLKYVANKDLYVIYDKETHTVALRPEEVRDPEEEQRKEDQYFRGA